jgi:phosphoribosylformimino-5-aminoimidazole carboxamide ribotide isomerase
MIIYPAIAFRDGRIVSPVQGEFAAELDIATNPVNIAKHWVAQGAEWLYVVNMDGPFTVPDGLNEGTGRVDIAERRFGADRANWPLSLVRLAEIRSAVSVPIQFAGGIRSLDDIGLALQLGADRVVVDISSIEQMRMIKEAIARFGVDQIVVAFELCDKKSKLHGRGVSNRSDAIELGHQVHALGARRVLVTDPICEANGSGINVETAARLGDVTGLRVIADGEVNTLTDVERLKAREHYNIEGVVLRRALYAGELELSEAVNLGHLPLRRRSAGIVPYRYTETGPEFLLIFNLFFDQWQFPRGGMEEHEDDLHAALREFVEETGLPIVQLYDSCRIELNYVAYIRSYTIERTVIYYLAEVGAGEVQLGNENHCEARWLDATETWELLTETSPEQLPALDAAIEFLETRQVRGVR